jgi:hypothetical protein
MYHIASYWLNSSRPEKPKFLKYKLRFATGITSRLHPQKQTPSARSCLCNNRILLRKTNRLEKPKKAIVAARVSEFIRERAARPNLYLAQYKERVGGWVSASGAHLISQLSRAEPRVPTRRAACFGSRLNCYPLVITPQPYHHLFSFEHPQRAGNSINNIIYLLPSPLGDSAAL